MEHFAMKVVRKLHDARLLQKETWQLAENSEFFYLLANSAILSDDD
jgi:hypothetical protein